MADGPPPLEEAEPSRPALPSFLRVSAPAAPAQRAAAPANPLLAPPQGPSLADEMAAAAAASQKVQQAARDKAEAAAAEASGVGIKRGFLLAPKQTTRKAGAGGAAAAAAAAAAPAAAAGPAAGAAPAAKPAAKGSLDMLRIVGGSSGSSSGSGSGGSSASASAGGKGAAPLLMPEVQSAMASQMPALAAKLSSGSWMTPELVQRIAAEPRLVEGMQQPRFQAALKEMQRDPAATLKKHASDAPLAEFLKCYMGILGEHFQKLGEAEDAARAAAGGSGSGSGGGGGGGSSGSGGSGIGLTPASTTVRKPTAQELAKAAAAASEASGADQEVRRALADPRVVELLGDADVQRMMGECRERPEALRGYMQQPAMRAKIMLMQKLGLIQLA